MKYNRYWVKFTILTMSGRSRETMERQYNAVTEKALRQSIKNRWRNSKPRIIKIKLLEVINN